MGKFEKLNFNKNCDNLYSEVYVYLYIKFLLIYSKTSIGSKRIYLSGFEVA